MREDQNNFNKMKWLIWIHQSNDKCQWFQAKDNTECRFDV